MTSLTKRAIKESLLRLLNEKPTGKITVKDIVEDCGINRNSFYYHYDDIPSLIEEIIRDEADLIASQHPTADTLEESFAVAAEFVYQNRQAALYLYRSTSRDRFEQYLMDVCRYATESYVSTVLSEVSQEDRDLLVRYYRCVTFGVLLDWLESGMKEDLDTVTAAFRRLCQLKRELYSQISPVRDGTN
jgi:AcrR family transcriptional regulator